jgi:hypothetical protein
MSSAVNALPQIFRARAAKCGIMFFCLLYMILQLDPVIMVETPLGRGNALFLIDYGMHQNTCWVVALQKDGVIKHFDCNDVILSTNYTYGFNLVKNINHPPEEPAGPGHRNKKK